MKQPYLPLYTGDWLKDPKLSLCSPATRGVWIDLICGLHELGQGGQVTATAQQIARMCRCSDAEVDTALKELRTTGAADVHEREGRITVICRRLKRASELSAKRSESGRKGGSKTSSKSKAKPDNDNEDDIKKTVESYCTEIGLPASDGTACYNRWQGNGWTVSGKPICDWKATIRSWRDHGYLPSQKQPKQSTKKLTIADLPDPNAPYNLVS